FYALTFLALLALLTGWWFIRNQILYGDPLAYRLLNASAIFPRETPLTFAEFWQINLPWFWQTFWVGHTPGDVGPEIYFALALVTLLASVGLVFLAAKTISSSVIPRSTPVTRLSSLVTRPSSPLEPRSRVTARTAFESHLSLLLL